MSGSGGGDDRPVRRDGDRHEQGPPPRVAREARSGGGIAHVRPPGGAAGLRRAVAEGGVREVPPQGQGAGRVRAADAAGGGAVAIGPGRGLGQESRRGGAGVDPEGGDRVRRGASPREGRRGLRELVPGHGQGRAGHGQGGQEGDRAAAGRRIDGLARAPGGVTDAKDAAGAEWR